MLKDTANAINEKIGGYMQNGVYDSAEAGKKELGWIHSRLTDIQTSIDSLEKVK